MQRSNLPDLFNDESETSPWKSFPSFPIEGNLNFEDATEQDATEQDESETKKNNENAETQERAQLLEAFKDALQKKDREACETIWSNHNVNSLKKTIKDLSLQEQIDILSLVVDMVNQKIKTTFFVRYINGVKNEVALKTCLDSLKKDMKNMSVPFARTKKMILEERLDALHNISMRMQKKKILLGLNRAPIPPTKKPLYSSFEEKVIEQKEEPVGPEILEREEDQTKLRAFATLNNCVLEYREILKNSTHDEALDAWRHSSDIFKQYFCGGFIIIDDEPNQLNQIPFFHHFELALQANISEIYEQIFNESLKRNELPKKNRQQLLELVVNTSPIFFEKYLSTVKKHDVDFLIAYLKNWNHQTPDSDIKKSILSTQIAKLLNNGMIPVSLYNPLSPALFSHAPIWPPMILAPVVIPSSMLIPSPMLNPSMLFSNPTGEPLFFTPGQNNHPMLNRRMTRK